MEPLINLHYLNQITFGDNTLIDDMLEEWIKDTDSKIILLKQKIDQRDLSRIDRNVHELKTNFFMIGSVQASRICEAFLQSDCQNDKQFITDIEDQYNSISNHIRTRNRNDS